VPLDEKALGGDETTWAHGAWLRLDPTPGTDADELGATGKLLAAAGKGVDWLQYLWNNYVMEMDRSRQHQAIYQPLVDWVKGAYERITSLDWWKQAFRQVLGILNPRNWNLDAWFSWRGGLVAMGICLILVGLYRIVAHLVRRLRRWLDNRRRQTARAARTRVEFYQRFQGLLRRRALRRPDGQTHREFARSLVRSLAAESDAASLIPLAEAVTDAFYQVRFGGHPLDKTHRQAVEQALSRLEAVLDPRRHARPREKETTAS